ncbi:MAG: polyphosphate kinase 1, partial [Candidatus Zixiibacteriota bacterium]
MGHKLSENNSIKIKFPYLNKEISWLSFNERILEEARDITVPLLERIRFLGIFSSNLDEFFRVRVAVLNRLYRIGGNARDESGERVSDILKKIEAIIIKQNKAFEEAYQDILTDLAQHDIFIINEKQLTDEQSIFVKNYFRTQVRPKLMPIMFDQVKKLPFLKDQSIYLAVALNRKKEPEKTNYALIEMPADIQSRFVELPRERKDRSLMLLDDVIRFGLDDIFGVFGYKVFGAYTIKLTRDAELEMDNDLWDSYPKKIAKSLKGRKGGKPVRFIYDAAMPQALLSLLTQKLRLGKAAILLAGGRYHNFRDFMNFPDFNLKTLKYPAMEPLSHPGINRDERLLRSIRERDVLIHFPYHSFGYVIDFLREASIDPKVVSMHITIYRVARNSNVLNALINAVRNGKEVSVVLELQARFDEETNIAWGNRLADEGVKVIYGVPGLKVHAKLALLVRREKKQNVRYAIIGTGNFNEDTAQSYLDHCLITKDKQITKEVHDVFKFYDSNYQVSKSDHLLVAPFNLRKQLIQLIKTEIANAQKNRPAYITIKINN